MSEEARCPYPPSEYGCGHESWLCYYCREDRADARCVARMAVDMLVHGSTQTAPGSVDTAATYLRLAQAVMLRVKRRENDL